MRNSNLIACIVEGAAESAIIKKLLEEERLIFSQKDLIDEELLRCRNARDFEEKYLRKSFDSKIIVYRVLDSRTEKFNLRKIYQNKIEVINIITSPEIEILVILKEGMFEDYCKYKNKLKPSIYCKDVLKLNKVKSADFIKNYFANVEELEMVIREYKKKHKFLKGEMCLADILKNRPNNLKG